MEEFRAIVRGRVQLVMFRDFTQRKGSGLGLVGTVRNLPDGTVEVIAQGERATLEQLIAKLHKGSLLSRVDAVEVVWHEPSMRFDRFRIVY
jgi:acylphosphatase